ncbi:hypothetical protein E2562_034575 [Oryza meyeriana var. granulata]|uniref:Uncharacterized protein n=1 Tax=Oryza meyeriana var. granulata TaxID=110450 RepID=A0A6G1ESI9_9ORYZ|nr:hypothetical protein E2562_034575 [Oryza meyeriana var. granulata]
MDQVLMGSVSVYVINHMICHVTVVTENHTTCPVPTPVAVPPVGIDDSSCRSGAASSLPIPSDGARFPCPSAYHRHSLPITSIGQYSIPFTSAGLRSLSISSVATPCRSGQGDGEDGD